MNQSEQSFINGFIKAANGFGLSEKALEALQRAGGTAENTSKALIKHPIFGNHAIQPTPEELAESLAKNRAEASMQAKYHSLDPANDAENIMSGDRSAGRQAAAGKFTPPASEGTVLYGTPKAPAQPGLLHVLKQHLSGAGKATAAGVGLGVGAHEGGQALGTLTGPDQHANILKNPQAALEAYKTMHMPEDPLSAGNLFQRLKGSIQSHPMIYGAGALGAGALGGLGYYMHKHPNQKSEQGEDQPGGPEDLQ